MRPNRWPIVRATPGSRSGPITINATTPISSSSEKPISNIWRQARGQAWRTRLPGGSAHGDSGAGASDAGPVLDLALDGLAGRGRDFRLGLARLVFLGSHAVLEAAHSAAQIGAEVAQLLGAEDQHDHQQHDEPVPDAE